MKFKNLLTSVILLTMITTSFLSGCGKKSNNNSSDIKSSDAKSANSSLISSNEQSRHRKVKIHLKHPIRHQQIPVKIGCSE